MIKEVKDMLDLKKKKYASPPTYKQINSILSKGWKLTSINSMSCLDGETISIKKQDGYLLSFEKCNNNKEYYCLQRFIYYSLWSREEYDKAREEIEEYKSRGACIISTVLGDRVALTRYKEVVPPLLSCMKEKVDVLYYIILPKEYVRKHDEKKADNEMLTYLGFRVYPNVVFGMTYFALEMLVILIMLWGEITIDSISESGKVLFLFFLFCPCAKDCYLFFATVCTENNIPFDIVLVR